MTFEQLMELALHSSAVTRPCSCAYPAVAGWERMPVEFPESQMRLVGTFIDDPYAEPTYQEYHPAGTSYWSLAAPIAPQYYPCNRCHVVQCAACGRAYLRYTEGGGYYVESRIRALDPMLLIDAALP